MGSQLDLEKHSPASRAQRPAPTAYDADFFRWTQEQAAFLRNGEWSKLDVANLVDEVETLGRSEKHEIRSRMMVLVHHLLKWKYQPGGRCSSWRGTIVEQRKRIILALNENPSLNPYPDRVLADEHETARLKAAGETGLAEDMFPLACPFTIGQILDQRYYPDDGAEQESE